ncbi:MAG: signal peptidase II [bacterium]|nr:signal peptidase II [bacterium]
MQKINKQIYFLISIVFFVIFDLYFSGLIINELRYELPQNPIFNLISVQNTGAAFNIFENSRSFLIIFAIVALLTIFIYTVRNAEKFSTLASFWAAMLVAGITCNLYERIIFGHVRDFIALNFIDFPVFNISDIFINISVIALIIIIIKNNYLKK